MRAVVVWPKDEDHQDYLVPTEYLMPGENEAVPVTVPNVAPDGTSLS